MDVSNFEKGLAVTLAWREERSNKLNGMLGVLFLVRARAKAGSAGNPDWRWCEGSWTRVMEKHGQFSSLSIVGDSQTVLFPDPRDPAFLDLLQIVDSVYDDTRPDNLTGGALYYCDIGKGVTPGGWFETNILKRPDLHPRTAQIGTTTYFK